MGTPIFMLAGQSNARRLSNEITAILDARYGTEGYVLVESYVSGAPLTRDARNKDDWSRADELPAQLIQKTLAATRSHDDGYAAGMIWLQGEADTWAVSDPASYQARLMDLLDYVSNGIAQAATPAARSFAEMNLIVAELADMAPAANTRDPWDEIIAQQKNTARDSDLVVSVDPDVLAEAANVGQGEMFDDALHYSDRFSDILANALVEAAIDMTDSPDPDRDPAPKPNLDPDIVAQPVPMPPAALIPPPQDVTPPQFWDADDSIFRGTTASERIVGTVLNDTIRGAGGRDTLLGREGDDRITGGHQDDTILGGVGRDTINGQRGDDVLRGGEGRDTVSGGRGNDQLFGESGADRLTGNHGSDDLWGGTGNDRIFGGLDDDTLSGGAGRDLLKGGKGRDVLQGGQGDDVLFGGDSGPQGDGQADIFVFRSASDGGGGRDRIMDFELDLDRIDVTSFGFSPALDAILSRAVSTNNGRDTRFDLGKGDTLLLSDVALTDLTLEHFLI